MGSGRGIDRLLDHSICLECAQRRSATGSGPRGKIGSGAGASCGDGGSCVCKYRAQLTGCRSGNTLPTGATVGPILPRR